MSAHPPAVLTSRALALALLVQLPGCDLLSGPHERAPDIKFGRYGEDYAEKPDFAQVEYELPLQAADLQKLLPSHLSRLTQEQLDQLYARLTAGAIPHGEFEGDLVTPRKEAGNQLLSEILAALPAGGMDVKLDGLEDARRALLGGALWKRKSFVSEGGERLVRTRIESPALLKTASGADSSPAAGKNALGGVVPRLLFPAKVYCGQSLLDGRRESIVIDYRFADELPGYRALPDSLAGRHGFDVRDELRMVRPGFYLGRAYLGKVFTLNFYLYRKVPANDQGPAVGTMAKASEGCWPGTQQRAQAASH
jgi:hypothetical protein